MRILIAIHGYKPALRVGGPVVTASAVAERLVRKGHEVIVFTCNSNLDEDLNVPLGRPVDVDGVEVWYFPRIEPMRWLPFLPYFSRSFGYLYSPQLRDQLEKIVPTVDLVHTQMPFVYPTLAASRAAWRYNKPLCYHQHGVLDPIRLNFRRLKKSIYLSLFELPILRSAATLIALNQAEEKSYRALGLTNECRIVPNGVSTEQYRQRYSGRELLGLPDDALIVLFMSRLHPLKGCKRLIRAFAKVRSRVPKSVLVVAGPDEWGLVESFKREAQSLGISEQVFFPGMVSGELKRDLLARADVFCLPSDSEGFSVALLEAMASKTALVITPGCNFPEVEQAGAGIVVNPDPGSVADGLVKLLSDQEMREEMSIAGFSLVEKRYSWGCIADDMEAVYRETVERHTGKAAVLHRAHKKDKLRFLFNVHAYKPAYEVGGPVKSVSNLAENLVRRGHEVFVATSNYNVGRKLVISTEQTYNVEGVQVRYFNSRPHPLQRLGLPYFSKSGFFNFDRDFYNWLEAEAFKFDVFDTQMAFLSSTAAFSHTARRLNKVYFYHQRGNLDPTRLQFRYFKKTLYFHLKEKAAIERADVLVALTDFEAQVFREHKFTNRIVIIPNGVAADEPLDNSSPRKSTNPVFLFLGRLHPTKGPEQFLDAFIKFAETSRGRAVICGPDDFNLLPALKRKIEQARVHDRVELLPPVKGDGHLSLLAQADVFVLPTMSEGFSVGILEAMNAGCAILTTPGAHFPEIERERCGLVVDRSVESLIEGMKQLTAEPSVIQACGERAQRFVRERYTWPKIVDLYEALALECHEKRQRALCEL